jgi:hypothetical protein
LESHQIPFLAYFRYPYAGGIAKNTEAGLLLRGVDSVRDDVYSFAEQINCNWLKIETMISHSEVIDTSLMLSAWALTCLYR